MKKLLTTLTVCLLAAHAAVAQNTLAGNLTVQQTVKLTGTITPAAITSNVNDYAPTGFAQAYTLRLSADAARNITGLAGGATGRTILVTNVGDFPLTFVNESTASTAANRFSLGLADYELVKGNTIGLWYDGTSSRWRPTNSLAVGGGGGTGTVTSVSVATANGVSGTVASPTTNPVITISLDAISPSSVAAAGTVSGSNLSGTNTGDQTDATLPFSDVTTNDVSTSKHGFAPKLPNDAAKYLDGTGAWTTPAGGGGGSGTVTNVSVVSANGVSGSVATPTTTPAITINLGAITPTSVAASGTVTGSNLSGTNTGDETGTTIRTKLGVVVLSGDNTGDQTSVTGNAGTATALQTARTINGVSFDGTANITVPAAAGTLTGTTLASGVTGSSLTSAAGGTFGTAAFTNSTAYDPAGAAAAITLSTLGGVPTTRTVNGHALSSNVTVSAGDVGLGSVENTALSTWAGSSNLTTLGTVTTGTWNGTPIGDSYISSASAWNAKVSFPGFGTTAGTAAEGNDARLSDARTPLAHTQAWSTITSTPTTLSGYGITDAQTLDADLTALAGLSTSGILARTGAGTAATRTITGTANQVTVINGDGVSGNPTLALPQSIATTSNVQFGNLQLGPSESSPATYGGQLKAYSAVNTSLESVGGIELPVATNGYGVKIQTLSADGAALAIANRNGAATWTERMRIAANGNVGIGTTAPGALLDLGTVSSVPKIYTYRDAAACAGFGINLSGGIYENSIFVGGTTDANGRISFGRRRADTGIYTERVVFNVGSGAVGINTASPSGILDVAKPSSGGRVQIVNEGANSYNVIASRNAADSAYLPLTVRTTELVVGSPSAGVIQQIQAPGETRVFVTNTTDSISCQVGASPSATYVGSYTSHPLELRTADTPRVTIGTSGGVQFNNYGAGTLVTDSSGNVTASSDASLKTVTGSFTRGLADVLKLTPRTYHWNEKSGMDTEDENVGFIAQEVLDAVPEAVGQYRTSEVDVDGKKTKKREKAELLTLSDRPLIAALVNAVKELKAENDALSARIAKLESKK